MFTEEHTLACSFLSLAVPSVKLIRGLRALRPLRVVVKSKEMKVVVSALMQAVPSITAVLLFVALSWLIFGIMGVSLFNGLLFRCNDPSAANKAECVGNYMVELSGPEYYNPATNTASVLVSTPRVWDVPFYNFDHLGNAVLALFQAASLNAWTDIMYSTQDITELDMQPSFNASQANALFFVVFVLIGAFFSLNLFIGVVIDNFNRLKELYDGSALLTIEQQQFNNIQRLVNKARLSVSFEKPDQKWRLPCFYLATHWAFDNFIMGCILFNTMTMMMSHYEQAPAWDTFLDSCGFFFMAVFTLEAVAKLGGFGPRTYFADSWNRFDFFLVMASLVGLGFNAGVGVSVLRVLRVGRIFRLLKKAKNLNALFNTLILSVPSLWNVGALVFVLFFTFAILGMSLFGETVNSDGGLDENIHFRDFGSAMHTLFRVATMDAWGPVFAGTSLNKNCDGSECGQAVAAVFYFVIYMTVCAYVMLNLYVAVIVDSFGQSALTPEEEATEASIEAWSEAWSKHDKLATRVLSVEAFEKVMSAAPLPFGFGSEDRTPYELLQLYQARKVRLHRKSGRAARQGGAPMTEPTTPVAGVETPKSRVGLVKKMKTGLLLGGEAKWQIRFKPTLLSLARALIDVGEEEDSQDEYKATEVSTMAEWYAAVIIQRAFRKRCQHGEAPTRTPGQAAAHRRRFDFEREHEQRAAVREQPHIYAGAPEVASETQQQPQKRAAHEVEMEMVEMDV